jgi:hypothetical protein
MNAVAGTPTAATWRRDPDASTDDPQGAGPPVDITAPNVLWQTDLTSAWCGEDGWAYFTAVIEPGRRSPSSDEA